MTTHEPGIGLNTSVDIDEVLNSAKERSEKRRGERSEWLENAKEGGSALTMREYMKAGIEEPWIFDDAHQRIFRVMFAEPGILRLNYDTFPKWAKSLGLSQDRELYLPVKFLDEFFGIESLLHRYLLFSLNSARGGEAQKQMFIIYGAAGTAKSQLAEASKRNLTESVMFRVEGCPINDHPFWLIPKHERNNIAAKLGIRIPQDKDLCLKCGDMLRREYNGSRWDEVKIEAITISTRQKRGIDVVPPFDPNTMGSEVMIGRDEFWRKEAVEKYLRWVYGGIGNANGGGILEFREWFKAPPEARHIVYMLTQEQQFPNPGYDGYSSANMMIIAHTNLPEVKRLKVGDEHDAFFDRVYGEFAEYPLSYRDNQRILEKMLSRTDIPRDLTEEEQEEEEAKKLKIRKSFLVPSPLTLIYSRDAVVHNSLGALAFASKVKTISHLVSQDKDSEDEEWTGQELMDILSMLAGEGEWSSEEIREHKEKHPTEGLHGQSPRFMDKCVEDAQAMALLRWRVEEPSSGSESEDREAERSEPCANIEDIKREIANKLGHELILAIESEDKQGQARIRSQISMLEGGFMDAVMASLKWTVFHDLLESGLLEEALGARVIERAIKEGCEKYYKEIKTLAIRNMDGDNLNSSGIDVVFLGEIERRIQKNMGVSIDSPGSLRKEIISLWEEDAQRREGLSFQGEEPGRFILKQLVKAMDQYIYDTRSEEFLEKTAEHIKSFARITKDHFQSKVLDKLPEYYCSSCLLRVLKVLLSPLQSMEEQEQIPIK